MGHTILCSSFVVLLSLNIMFGSFIQVAACHRRAFFFSVLQYSIPCLCPGSFHCNNPCPCCSLQPATGMATQNSGNTLGFRV